MAASYRKMAKHIAKRNLLPSAAAKRERQKQPGEENRIINEQISVISISGISEMKSAAANNRA